MMQQFRSARLRCLLVLACAGSAAAAPDYSQELVPIPGGRFLMGSADGDRDERPVREVAVDSFETGRTEVTVGWYLRCMADGACAAPTWWGLGYFEEHSPDLSQAEKMSLPVTGVSWRDAQAFCRWLGSGYALPTEAEWEYAAGAGGGRIYPWGDDPKERIPQAGTRKRLMPVGSAQPNPLGLHGMAGGAWEWVEDCYDPRGRGDCAYRTTKGGSWSDHTWNLRVANKSYGLDKQGYKGLGFRVVRRAR
jgi:formylglycine-generating enzyme required for sulfatase activity